MITYCVKCRKSPKSLDSKISKRINNRLIIQSKCAVCRIKKLIFVKEQEARGLLCCFGIKTPLNKIPLIDDVLF